MDVVNELKLVALVEHQPLHAAVRQLILKHGHVFADLALDLVDREGHFGDEKLPDDALNPAPLVNFKAELAVGIVATNVLHV